MKVKVIKVKVIKVKVPKVPYVPLSTLKYPKQP